MGAALPLRGSGGSRPGCRLTHGVGQGKQVVGPGLRRLGRHGKAQDFPAPRNGQ
jgi:hypothetical protein